MPRRKAAQTPEELLEARQRRHDAIAARYRTLASAAGEIGDIEEPLDTERRARCQFDLHAFLTTYFPGTTGLHPFSADHLRVIKRIEQCVLHGGRFTNCVFRGFAKTTISENSVIWAILYGHRRFVCLFGGNATAAQGNLDSIKAEFETNDLLLEDFPEVVKPIRHLGGNWAKARGQHQAGQRTFIEWTSDKIVMPTVKENVQASGSVIICKGVTAVDRGIKHKREVDGIQQRPDMAIIDDPQTDESAKSQTQITNRLDIIKRAILKLAGHQTTLACVINATVLEEGDVVDQLLDHNLNAAWQGERIPFVQVFPDAHESLWLKSYADIRRNYDPKTPGDQARAHEEATEFYRARRPEMDKGAVVTWDYAFDPDKELSALQHAYNALIDDGEESFASEYQSNPKPRVSSQSHYASVGDILAKRNGLKKNWVPSSCSKLTAFVDVQGELLYYVIVAWADGFGGYILDYGSYPNQSRSYFTLASAVDTLERLYPTMSLEARIRKALDDLCEGILNTGYKREDGIVIQVEKLLVDANWGASTDVVYQFCRESPHRRLLMPSHGKYYGAASIPINDKKSQLKRGEQRGLSWLIPEASGKADLQHVVVDTNFWKSFVHARFLTPAGDKGSLSLFEAPPNVHRMLADHCTAEFPVRTFGRNREVDEWKPRPGNPDNHLFDCLVGAHVAASICGVKLLNEEAQGQARTRRKVVLRA